MSRKTSNNIGINLFLLLLIPILIIILLLIKKYFSKDSYYPTKTIIIGDSRTTNMADDISAKVEMILFKPDGLSVYKINDDVYSISRGGAGIDWLKNIATDHITNKINDIRRQNPQSNINLVFNIGVNECYDSSKIDKKAKEIVDYINESLRTKWKNTPTSILKVYYLSVNPVDQKLISKCRENKEPIRTNSSVEKINASLQKYGKNFIYCDSFNEIKDFNYRQSDVCPSPGDGVHYSPETSQRIYQYIINNCVKK